MQVLQTDWDGQAPRRDPACRSNDGALAMARQVGYAPINLIHYHGRKGSSHATLAWVASSLLLDEDT